MNCTEANQQGAIQVFGILCVTCLRSRLVVLL